MKTNYFPFYHSSSCVMRMIFSYGLTVNITLDKIIILKKFTYNVESSYWYLMVQVLLEEWIFPCFQKNINQSVILQTSFRRHRVFQILSVQVCTVHMKFLSVFLYGTGRRNCGHKIETIED